MSWSQDDDQEDALPWRAGQNVRERRFLVDHNFEGWRLDRFLSNRLGRMSRTKANAVARYGDVTLEPPRRPKPSLRLHLGDVVLVREHLEDEQVQDDEVRVLYEDDALLILDKPAGMLVHESVSVRLNTIQGYLERAGWVGAEPVHRIDRETSGVVVCARQPAYVPTLRRAFATDHPDKIYRALVLDAQGRWLPGQRQTLTQPLGLVPGPVLELRMGPGSLPCTTHVLVLGELEHPWGRMADLWIRIETGRQHQIRAHLAMCGTPIAGDKLYGQTDEFFMAICDRPEDPELLAALPLPRQALHAWRMTLAHPDTGLPVRVEAALPCPPWPAGQGQLPWSAR